MKDFRGMINRYLLDHEQQKKYLAIVLALSMLVTFAVPLSLMQNAESTTVKPVFTTQLANAVDASGRTLVDNLNGGQTANNGYSSGQLSEVTLLIGDNVEWAKDCKDAEDVVEAAKQEYFLGIASDFCVFLRGNFTPKDADAEGRVAVGGNVSYERTDGNKWNYQVGAGDYNSSVSLKELDNYLGRENFAHLIMGGNTITNVAPFGTINAGGNLAAAEKDLYKRFVIPSTLDLTTNMHYADGDAQKAYAADSHKHYNVDFSTETAQFYSASLIDFEKTFTWIESQSTKLSRKPAHDEVSIQSEEIVNGVLTFDASEVPADTKTIYFKMDQWSKDITEVRFDNIPEVDGELANIVVNCGGKTVNFHEEKRDTGGDVKFSTYINNVCISKFDNNSNVAKTDDNKDVGQNTKQSEKILYNFYEALDLTIGAHVNGTILAPKAAVVAPDTSSGAHLSGALIATSFKGGLEFGYRPYRGTTDILGSTSGYPVPMRKFKENGITPLAGAGFTLKKGEEIVESWTSNGSDKPQYITIPTAVDYDGGTNYNTAITDIITTYTMQEASPPEGYIGTDDQYTITVQEVIDPSGLIKADETSENTIPTKVQVTITVVGPGGDEVLNTTMTVTDTYDTESNQQTRRAIELNGNTYYLDMTNGKITSINKPTGEMTDSSYESNGTIVYTETADDVKQVESYYTVTEEITTEVPVTDENGQVITDANGETFMVQTQTVVPVTGVETSTVYATDTDNSYVTDENGSTVTETVIVSSSVVTDKILIDSGYTTEYDATKDTTYVVFTSVTVVESVVDPTTVTTSGTITLDGKDYYFDPDSMMLMPVPTAVPSFTNRYGYVFEKNDGSEPLSSADMANAVIYLEKKDGENYSQIKQITSSRITLEPDELTENTLYRFNEQTPPSGYEQADPVYMVKSGGKIYWLSSAEEPSVDTVKNSLDNFTITDDNLDNRTIEMKDQKIYGAKVKLQKTDVTGTTKLTGAYFRLLTGNTKVYPVDNWNEGFRIDEELDLFEVLKAAAPESYDENYVQDGYLKKGTYSLEEVTAPGGYQTPAKPYKFKIELDNGNYTIVPLSSDAPEYITFTASTAWGKEIWAYGSATDVTKIEVEVTSPADGSTLILYEDPVKTSLHGKYVSVVGGVATFTEVPNAIGNFKVQNQSYNTGVTVKEVRVYGTASDGGSTATTYTYGQTAWNDNNADTIRISTFTVYYDDGTQEIVENPTHGNQGDHWMPVNISLNKKDGIVGIEIVTTGSGTRKLMIQASDNSTAIYTQDMTAGETYIFGTIPTDSPTDTDDTTQNTESTNSMPLTVTGNTISIPNELMGAKTDITVQKDWEKDELYSSVTRPDKITVQLYQATTQEQMTNNQGTAYGDPVEITPNTDGEWTHTWSQIPNQVTNTDGSVTTYLYYAREVSTPSGYTVSYPDDGKTIIHITNTLNTISLTAHKKWVDSKGNAITSNSIPGVTLPEISVKLQYSENGTDGWKDLPNSTQTLNASNSWTYNYKDIPSGYTYKMVERDVPDGWTVGESTTTNQNNGTVEIENKLQTGSLQVTKKWSGDESDTSTRPGSITVNVYRKEVVNSGTTGGSAEDDTTGGNTEVSEDAVVARFLYQKGNGYTDHDTYWGPPESQPSRANQMYWTTNSASDIAANYAAALAQFAVNFPGDDKSENYLNAAKALYDFSTKYNSCATEHCSGFYPSTSCTDEQAWAAAWLYLATNDATYKTACETKLSACGNPEIRGYFWDDVMLGAEAVYAAHIDDTPSWTKVTNYLNTYCTGDSFRVLNGWGSARHNALLQTLALVTDKNMQTQNYQEWCKNQMSIILGNNTFGNNGTAVNLVIGFADNAIKNPHHKAATGTILVDTVNDVQWDDIWNTWNGIFGDESHVLVGALASGPNGSTVNDNCKDHTGNEVALDYNAGLVGAAAGLYSVYGTGTLVNNGADIDSEVESKYDGFVVTRQPAYTSNITEDYSRLLQYSLYFYDANMCGDFTAENSAFSWRPACHTDDEVDGGFHDAGDHVMFGLPQGFSASTLGWVYYEFRDSFDSLGQTAHYKTIMEEFCDFFVDSIEFEEPSQQTLTLSNTQSQKASAIKGISVVGSEKVAKATEKLIHTITINQSSVNAGYNNLGLQNVIKIECVFDEVSSSNGLNFVINGDWSNGWCNNRTDNKIVRTYENGITLNEIYVKDLQVWKSDGSDATLQEIRVYTEGEDNSFTISATIPDNREKALLTDTVILTPAYNAGNVTYTVKYADNTIETLTGNSFIPKKSGTVTITGNDGTTNAETQITVSSMTMSIPNNNTTLTVGSSATLTLANVGYDITSWTANVENVVTIQPNGSTAQITATAACADGVTITATDANGNTASIKITIPDPDVLSLSCNKQKMRVDDTANLTPSPADEVTYQLSKEGIVEINGNTVTAVGVGQVTITAKRKGYEAPVTINVVEALTITGDPTMNIDETQTLTANGAIGTITWAISGEDEGIVTLDAATGEVTAEKNGNVTIIATDSHDNAVAEFTISVELTAANANIPSGAELIGQIEVKLDTATGEWTKNEGLNGFDPENLPLCSPNGNPYEYYIEEVLTDGVVSGNSASYVPIEYSGSGVQLANGSAAAMSVENELKSSTETTGTLPSTGGGGVKIYYAAGLVMMLSGIAGYLVTKRRRNSQS